MGSGRVFFRNSFFIGRQRWWERARCPVEQRSSTTRGSSKAGTREGAARTLSTLIAHKFGDLPAWARVRLNQATEAELQRRTLQILDAQRVQDIFA